MTTLNSRLQLALLNRKKGRNLLEKGFTLVELMIVIVIVGILSAVALPNFLSQTTKAKGTECASKIGAILSQVGAEHLLDPAKATILLGNEITTANTAPGECTYSDAGITAPQYGVSAVGRAGLALDGKFSAKSCVNGESGSREVDINTGDPVTAPTQPACT